MPRRVETLLCETVVESLEAWLDGELPPERAHEVANHVSSCASCAVESEIAREVLQGLRSLPQFNTPDRVLAAVRRETRGNSDVRGSARAFTTASSRPVRFLAAAAAILLAVLVGQTWRGRAGPEYTDQEIQRATQDTKLAFALVGETTRLAEREVRLAIDERAVNPAVRGISRSLKWTEGVEDGDQPTSGAPSNEGEGSS